jgi:hypothetical protein
MSNTQTHLSLNAIWARVEYAQPTESRWQRIGAILMVLKERGQKVQIHQIKCIDHDSGVSAHDYYLRMQNEATFDLDIDTMEEKLRQLVSDWGNGGAAEFSHKAVRALQSLPRDITRVEESLLDCTRQIIQEEMMHRDLALNTCLAHGSSDTRRL